MMSGGQNGALIQCMPLQGELGWVTFLFRGSLLIYQMYKGKPGCCED